MRIKSFYVFSAFVYPSLTCHTQKDDRLGDLNPWTGHPEAGFREGPSLDFTDELSDFRSRNALWA